MLLRFVLNLDGSLCPARDIKNRILQSSNSPILEFERLQKAFEIKDKAWNIL